MDRSEVSEIETKLTEMYELTLSALVTDGEHHKQYYLEELLRYLVSPQGFEDLRETLEWKRGIAP